MDALASPSGIAAALRNGFRASGTTFALIVAINAAIAAIMSIEDPRPFWHPLVSAQCMGLAIAYAVNAASPWERTRAVWRLVGAVAAGAALGITLIVLIKGPLLGVDGYSMAAIGANPRKFVETMFSGFFMGMLVSLFFLLKFREKQAESALHRAEAERHRLSKLALESELKLMQAQVEPHFLFNTLASVQYLTETDPPQASRLLTHLLAYLRAALPQLRSGSATLGQEIEFAEAYLNILRMRMGPRLDFTVDVPEALRAHPFPPVLLISIVENAVTHGLEPRAEGGYVTIAARESGERLVVTVTDTGVGLASDPRPGGGIGLANVRERLAALYGPRGRFTLEEATPRGARATIEIPLDAVPLATAQAAAA